MAVRAAARCHRLPRPVSCAFGKRAGARKRRESGAGGEIRRGGPGVGSLLARSPGVGESGEGLSEVPWHPAGQRQLKIPSRIWEILLQAVPFPCRPERGLSPSSNSSQRPLRHRRVHRKHQTSPAGKRAVTNFLWHFSAQDSALGVEADAHR